MRAGELCGLRLGDLHLDDGYAIVLGKGRKQRPVKIGARAAKAIRFYLLHWRAPALPQEDHVFLSCRGVGDDGDAFANRDRPVRQTDSNRNACRQPVLPAQRAM